MPAPADDDSVDALIARLEETSVGKDPAAFEIACCDVFAHLGFRTQHMGGRGNPDGIADAELGPLAFRVMLECKCAGLYKTPHHPASGIVYKPDIAEAAKFGPLYGADSMALLAPDYGSNLETLSECKLHKVTAFTVADLTTLLHIEPTRSKSAPSSSPASPWTRSPISRGNAATVASNASRRSRT